MQISQQIDLTNPQIPLNFNISLLKLKQNKKDSLVYLTEKKAYTAIASCVYEHIINTPSLTTPEKLCYILADCLALISFKKGSKREVKLSGEQWAAKLGCSKTTIFDLQESLKDKGYFKIVKGKDEDKQDHRNIITPTLPDEVFDILEKTENKADDILPFDTSEDSKDCKRSYLDRAKLFIPSLDDQLGGGELLDNNNYNSSYYNHSLVDTSFNASCSSYPGIACTGQYINKYSPSQYF